jgi:hypothetical protein
MNPDLGFGLTAAIVVVGAFLIVGGLLWVRARQEVGKAEVYARLLSALAGDDVLDHGYRRQLTEAILQANGDQLMDLRLTSSLSTDFALIGGRHA